MSKRTTCAQIVEIGPETFKEIERGSGGRKPKCPYCGRTCQPYAYNFELTWSCDCNFRCDDKTARALEAKQAK